MPSEKTTHCPNCGVEIDVNELLYQELETKAKAEMSAQINTERKKLAEKTTAIETQAQQLETTISEEFWMTPEDFKSDYRSMHGAGFSIAPIFSQSAWFRYHNRDPHIPNLYFSAAGAHPGAGMPGVLCSAKVVEALIEEEGQIGKAI